MNANVRLGFLLPHLGDNDLSKAFVKSANEFLCDQHYADIIAFVNNQVKPVLYPVFASMNINEAFDYKGGVVATNLDTAAKLAKFPGPRPKYYYLWQLDWINSTGWTFEEMMGLFHDPQILIVARTDDDKKLIESCWNCRVHAVIPECNVRAFAEKIKQDEN